MPIEIKELIIKATIEEEGAQKPQNNASQQSGTMSEDMKEEILTECIEMIQKNFNCKPKER